METVETTMRTMDNIKQDYRAQAAILGQIAYEYEVKKQEIMEKMVKLNQEAYAMGTPADEKN